LIRASTSCAQGGSRAAFENRLYQGDKKPTEPMTSKFTDALARLGPMCVLGFASTLLFTSDRRKGSCHRKLVRARNASFLLVDPNLSTLDNPQFAVNHVLIESAKQSSQVISDILGTNL
jgi:hypothetical protein